MMADGSEKIRRTHGNGGRDDLLPVLDDDMDVRVRLGDEDRLRADAAPDVDEHRALGEILPREPCPTTSERHAHIRALGRRDSKSHSHLGGSGA